MSGLAANLRAKGDEHDARRPSLDPPASTIAYAIASTYYDAAAMTDAERPTVTLAPGVEAEVLHGSLEGPVLVARVTFAPGAAMARETHADHVEHLIVLSGEIDREAEHPGGVATWRVGGEHGAAASVPQGAPHVVRNASATEPAELISVLRRLL